MIAELAAFFPKKRKEKKVAERSTKIILGASTYVSRIF